RARRTNAAESRRGAEAPRCRVRPDTSTAWLFGGRRRRRGGRTRAGSHGLHRAGNLAAAFDLDLAIGDLARDLAAAADQQTAAHAEAAFEAAADLGLLDFRRPLELAGLADLDETAVGQLRFHLAFDDDAVAGGDLAREADLAADHQHLGFRMALTAVAAGGGGGSRLARGLRQLGAGTLGDFRAEGRRGVLGHGGSRSGTGSGGLNWLADGAQMSG